MELKDTYNKIARDWAVDHEHDDWWIKGTDKLISLLPSGASVLDVGCGPGQKSAYLEDHGLEVVGTDFSEEMVKVAREKVSNAEFKVLDLYAVDTVGKKFDCVFAQAVLLHIPKKDIPEIFKKIKSILNEGGLFYLAVKEQREGAPEEKIVAENDYGYEYQRFFSYFSIPELEKYLTQTGFRLIYKEVASVASTRWIEIIAKL